MQQSSHPCLTMPNKYGNTLLTNNCLIREILVIISSTSFLSNLAILHFLTPDSWCLLVIIKGKVFMQKKPFHIQPGQEDKVNHKLGCAVLVRLWQCGRKMKYVSLGLVIERVTICTKKRTYKAPLSASEEALEVRRTMGWIT